MFEARSSKKIVAKVKTSIKSGGTIPYCIVQRDIRQDTVCSPDNGEEARRPFEAKILFFNRTALWNSGDTESGNWVDRHERSVKEFATETFAFLAKKFIHIDWGGIIRMDIFLVNEEFKVNEMEGLEARRSAVCDLDGHEYKTELEDQEVEMELNIKLVERWVGILTAAITTVISRAEATPNPARRLVRINAEDEDSGEESSKGAYWGGRWIYFNDVMISSPPNPTPPTTSPSFRPYPHPHPHPCFGLEFQR